ncbi:hypothetical protein [Paludisphaera borealis]|uniref:hypothetical protein n=1 Tax=Paludisphaera borealis TaxID=1387353 RepID=UPI0035A3A520
MNHHATPRFWSQYHQLPERVQQLADSCFALLRVDPRHPSLHFRNVGRFWSARVGLHYRALAVQRDDDFVWFWIGSHAEYDRLVGRP